MSEGSGDQPDSEVRGSLTSTARSGFVWQSTAFVLARLTLLASTIVLARALGPADYGIISLALTIVVAVGIICDLGMSQAVVYLPRNDRRTDSALGGALFGSLSSAVLWVIVAPIALRLTGHAELIVPVSVLALVLVLTAVGQVPDAVLRKQLQFSRRLPGEMARGLGRGGVAIALALSGYGVWSLVWAEVVGAGAYALVSWLMLGRAPGSPRHWLDRGELRQLLRFGVPASLNGLLATAAQNVDYLVVAWMLGSVALGSYFVGFRIPELVVVSVFQVFSQIAYPLYTRVKDEPERLRRAVLQSLRVQALYGLTTSVAIAVTAPLLVPALFGAEYGPAVPVMRAIAIYALFRSLSAGAADLFKAVGRPELAMWLGVWRLVVLLPALVLGSRWGLEGVGWAQAGVALVFTLITQREICRLTGVTWRQVGTAIRSSLIVAGVAGLVSGLVMWWVPGQDLLAVVVVGLATVVAAGATLLLTDRGLVGEVFAR